MKQYYQLTQALLSREKHYNEGIMSPTAEIINIHRQQASDNMKADTENGYYRIANELALALCSVRLSDRESRIVQSVMLKTFGFNKTDDWICNAQIAELTEIGISHISEVKKRLFNRNILIKNGRKIGINTMVSQWIKNPVSGIKKPDSNFNKKTLYRVFKNPVSGNEKPDSGLHKRQDKTIDIKKINKKKYVSPPLQKSEPPPEPSAKKSSAEKLDFSDWHSQPSEQILKDWFALRKRKKANVSQTVINRFGKQLNLALQNGFTADFVFGECVYHGWTGFECQWLIDKRQRKAAQSRYKPDDINDTSWADGLKI